MSYILDSLKKSEQKRQENSVPDLNTVHVPDAPTRRRFWPYLLLLILAANAALLLVWFAHWSNEQAPPEAAVRDVPVSEVPVNEPVEALNTEQPRAVQVTPPASGSTGSKLSSIAGKTDSPLVEGGLMSERQKDERVHEDASKIATGTVQEESSDSVNAQRLYLPAELPAEVAAQVPALSLSLHYFSRKPEARMVRVNGNNLREGDELKSGVTVGEITPHGVVIQVSGYRVWLKKP